MENKLNYVQTVLDKKIIILCNDTNKKKYLRSLGAKRKFIFRSEWVINYSTETDLGNFFSKLRNENFSFSYDQHGWGPSDLFKYLREKKLLEGSFVEIYWVGPGKYNTKKNQ